MLPKINLRRAASLQDAVHQTISGSIVCAGGTDLIGCLRDGVLRAENIISIQGISELRGIATTRDGGLRIGALTTLTEVADHPMIREHYRALAEGAAAAASPQLRNQGTIGGNICQRPRCWYFRGDFHCLRKGGGTCFAVGGENEFHCIFGGSGCYIVHPSDTAPALVALDARAVIVGKSGRRKVPLRSFFTLPNQELTKENILEPGEIVSEIVLPPVDGCRSSYRKVRARGSWDFALAGVALALKVAGRKVEKARIVLSGVAPAPWPVASAEKMLVGQELHAEIISQVASACVMGAEPMTQNAYKVDLVRGIVEESLSAMA
ncbi:MAG TPA: xanthine dehydrogenase family protein subunit M [Blastocatellia bacterium]|nr:xanthine dehydrogenase family protein subunit M [Blastocatellia bacterium]